MTISLEICVPGHLLFELGIHTYPEQRASHWGTYLFCRSELQMEENHTIHEKNAHVLPVLLLGHLHLLK